MKRPIRIKATIEDTDHSLEKAISIAGWSHASNPRDIKVLFYPFTMQVRTAHFTAPNRSTFEKQVARASLWVRDVCEE